MILSNRLEAFAKENKLIDDTHIGFKKGSRTVDHMFILTTLIDKYVKKNLNRHCMCVLLILGKHTTVYGDKPFYISFLE